MVHAAAVVHGGLCARGDGTRELRLHGTGLQIGGDGVSGSVRGRGIDQGSPLRGRRDVNVTLGGPNGVSTLSGTASRGAYLVTAGQLASSPLATARVWRAIAP